DSRFLGEVGYRVGRDIVRPVVNVQPRFLGPHGAGEAHQQQRNRPQAVKIEPAPHTGDTAAGRPLVNPGSSRWLPVRASVWFAALSGYLGCRFAGCIFDERMRPILTAMAAALSLLSLAACVPPQQGGGGHPNPIIVRDFTFSNSVVTLDGSFGF